MALANSLDCINALSVALCSLSEPALDDGADVAGVLRVPGLALVAHLHDGAAVVGVRGVLHILDPPVRKGNLVKIYQVVSLRQYRFWTVTKCCRILYIFILCGLT